MDAEVILKAYEASKRGQSYAFATIIEATKRGTPRKTGAKMVVLEDGSVFGSIGGGRNEKNAEKECLKALKSGESRLVEYLFDDKPGNSICGGKIKVFIEPFAKKRHFVICGAGHIALPLSIIAKMLNFEVSIVDNRKTFANKKRFPHVDAILVGTHAQKLKKIPLTPSAYVFIVTQGHEHDYSCLKNVLKSEAAYVGFISSKVKKVKFFRKLRKEGFKEKDIQRIHAPMGLNIGAETPEEIAVSIMAEIVAQTKNMLGKSLKFNYKY